MKNILVKKDGTRRKLAPKYIGPFTIVALAETPDTYRLNIPSALRMHNEFHTSRLKPWFCDPDPTRMSSIPPLIDDDGNEVYLVEAIVGRRVRNRKIEYRVRWLGYNENHDTWEPKHNLRSVTGLIEAFENARKAQ